MVTEGMSDPKSNLCEAFPFIRFAVTEARAKCGSDGSVYLTVSFQKKGEEPSVMMRLQAEDFIKDLAAVLELPSENSKEEDLAARAEAFCNAIGLKRSCETSD
jgi:hypothetical protein